MCGFPLYFSQDNKVKCNYCLSDILLTVTVILSTFTAPRIVLNQLMTFQAGVPGNDWTNMIVEATTEVLKLGSSSVALLFQALLHVVTKTAARSVFLTVLYYPLLKVAWKCPSVLHVRGCFCVNMQTC